MVSHLEVSLLEKPLTPNKIGEYIKGHQRKLWKKPLFVKYYKNKNVSLLSYPIPIKYPPEGKKALCSLIDTSIKEVNCSDEWNFFSCHCANGSYKIQGIYFDQSYSTVAHYDSYRINIAIVDIHRLSARILDVINALQNTNVTIHERVCVSTPPYYLEWFKTFYPNFTLN